MGTVIIKTRKTEIPKQSVKRIAAYCRISTTLEEQKSSLNTQTEVFYNKICANKEWKLAGIYADEGFSGTQAADRPEFQRLIKDCREGRIDIILTKSISRFARNTLECISYIRELKEMGVSILFEENGLDTGSEASELILSILAAVAQEESRNISTNVKWSLEKKFKEGKAKWSPTYGYRKTEETDFVPDDQTAPVVKRIYEEYYRGSTLPAIAENLERDQIPAPGGKSKWWPKVIDEILKNEKYIGDVLCQKTYTIDHLTHRRVKNTNAEAAATYYIKNHHIPVISREVYDHVQIIFSLKDKRHGSIQYPYHTFLICPYCQKPMRRVILNEHGRPGVWHCSAYCTFYYIPEYAVQKAFLEAYYGFTGLKKNKTEYYMLAETVHTIEFPENKSWNYMKVNWKHGGYSQVKIQYKKPRDIPGSSAQISCHKKEDLQERSRKNAGNRNGTN